MNPAERAEGEEIKKMSEKVKELHVRLEQLKKKKVANQALFSSAEKASEEIVVIFNPSQIETITTNLTQMLVFLQTTKSSNNIGTILKYNYSEFNENDSFRGKDIAELIVRAKTLQDQVESWKFCIIFKLMYFYE